MAGPKSAKHPSQNSTSSYPIPGKKKTRPNPEPTQNKPNCGSRNGHIVPTGLGGTYSLVFTDGIRIWADEGNGVFTYLTSGISLDATQAYEFFVEGFSPNSEDTIQLDYVATDGQSAQGIDKVKINVERVNVQWARIADMQSSAEFNTPSGRLEHQLAINKSKGAYIPLNNDDDESNQQEDRLGFISNQENDLLPIYVRKMRKDTGNGDYSYSLHVPSTLRIWVKNSDGGYHAFTDSDLSFGPGVEELTFYVDAIDNTAQPVPVTLRVEHPKAPKPFTQRLYANVFEVEGPRNVPDFSVYEYRVSDNIATRAGTLWVAPGFGALRDGDPTPNDNVDSARNFWNQSPKIAKARYQATTDYVWAFDINVVKIVLGTGTGTLDNSKGQNPFLDFAGESVRALSGLGTQNNRALTSTYQITAMNGPTRGDSQQRGIEKMLVGYMQLLTATTYNATYANNRSYAHVMQGNTYVDVLTQAQGPNTLFPWYDSEGLSSEELTGDGLMRGQDYIANERQIAMTDTPVPFFPLRDPDPNKTGPLQTATFAWNFELIVAVGTLEVAVEDRTSPPNGPGDRYPFFRRAVSTWSYSGTISRAGNGLTDLTFSSSGAQIGAWMEEQDGQLVFDQEVRRYIADGAPIMANNAINIGEGNGIWFEQ